MVQKARSRKKECSPALIFKIYKAREKADCNGMSKNSGQASRDIPKNEYADIEILVRNHISSYMDLVTENNMDAVADEFSTESANFYLLKNVIKYAAVIVSTVPILCLYPFLQKYFMKGVLVGSLKE